LIVEYRVYKLKLPKKKKILLGRVIADVGWASGKEGVKNPFKPRKDFPTGIILQFSSSGALAKFYEANKKRR